MARVPRQIDLSDILSEQNPHIDLRIEIYENSTRNFLKAISNFKNQFISQISERRAHQANEKKKILERTQAVEAETNACKLREIALVAGMPFPGQLLPVLRDGGQTWRGRRKKERMQNSPLLRSNAS